MDWRRVPWKARHVVGERALSEARRRWAMATHAHARIEFRGPAYVGRGFQLMIPDNGTLIVGSGVQFRRDFVCEIHGNGRVEIGDNVIFTYGCVIQCSTSIKIGEGAIIAQQSLIVDGNHRFRDPTVPLLEQGYDYRPITIGPGALVLSKCTIVNDVGERAVIGANSVVTRPIPPYSVAAGTPARVLERFGPDERVPG